MLNSIDLCTMTEGVRCNRLYCSQCTEAVPKAEIATRLDKSTFLLTDQGSSFAQDGLQEIPCDNDIRHTTSRALTPESCRMVERCNRSPVEDIKASMERKQIGMIAFIAYLLCAVRTLHLLVLRTSPAKILMGFESKNRGRQKTKALRVMLMT